MVGGSGELGQASERGSSDTIERAADVFLRALHFRLTVYFISNFFLNRVNVSPLFSWQLSGYV